MSLLRDIQQTAVAADGDVATLLRKCKILAVRLRNAEFKRWVDQELNGYEDLSSLPEYRKLQVESVGDFYGAFGSGLKNAPIPPSCLPKNFQDSVRYSYLMEPISAYTSLVDKTKRSNAQENWPADLVAHFGQAIYKNMNCVSAWKIVPYNAIVALVDTIKTRVLNFCLEIEAEASDAGEAPLDAPPISQDKVTQVFNTYITGKVQNVSAGGSHFNQQATAAFETPEEVFRALLEAVMTVSHEDSSAQAMAAAIKEMRDSIGTRSFGSRYQAFMSLLANHHQVYGSLVAPYLPALAALVAT